MKTHIHEVSISAQGLLNFDGLGEANERRTIRPIFRELDETAKGSKIAIGEAMIFVLGHGEDDLVEA